MLNFTYAFGDCIGGLYKDGKLIVSGSHLDMDDLIIFAKKQPFTLKKLYIDDEWFRKIACYYLPEDEKDLVLADD